MNATDALVGVGRHVRHICLHTGFERARRFAFVLHDTAQCSRHLAMRSSPLPHRPPRGGAVPGAGQQLRTLRV